MGEILGRLGRAHEWAAGGQSQGQNQGRDAEGQQVLGIASGTPLGLAWKGQEIASVQGPKGLEAVESRAKAKLLWDG